MPYQVGDQVGDYQVVGVLGAGGMGQVYKVRNVISERLEAMKVLLPDLEHDPALADRFLREIKVLAALEHPNIAALRTAFRAGNQLVMVMELVEGESLAERVRQGPIPIPEAVNYFCQALAALHYAHSRGVVHRDIKPANIMVTKEGTVKLMDFGIAKAAGDRQLTRTGTTLGSLYYMSPEQVTGGSLDARSDVYSMGVALYEVLTGVRPFQGDSEFSIMAAHLEGQVTPPIQLNPLLDPALNELIMVAIAKDPAQRFQSAEAFRTALEQVGKRLGAVAAPLAATRAVGEAPSAPPPPPAQPSPPAPVTAGPPQPAPAQPPPAPGRHRGLYMALGAALAIGLLVLAATQLPRWLRTSATDSRTTVTPAQPEQLPPTPAQAGQAQPEASTGSPLPAAGAETAPAAPAGRAPAEATAGPAARPAGAMTGRGLTPSSPVAAPDSKQAATQPPVQEAAPVRATPVTPAEPPAASERVIQQLHDRMVKLASRAGAVRGSLENLQRQQAAMGLGLRGDVSASWKRMEYYLDQAEAALSKGDAAAARRHLDAAEREVDQLETFLGR